MNNVNISFFSNFYFFSLSSNKFSSIYIVIPYSGYFIDNINFKINSLNLIPLINSTFLNVLIFYSYNVCGSGIAGNLSNAFK